MPTRIATRDEEMLRPREAKFVAAYLESLNPEQAAKEAGYAGGGLALTRRPRIRRALKTRMDRALKGREVTTERIIDEYAKIAFANIDDFVDEDYQTRTKPGRRAMAAVQSVKTTYAKDKDGFDTGVKSNEIRMYSKLDALNGLARVYGMFRDKLEVDVDLGGRLERAFEKLETIEADAREVQDENPTR